jgi:hypothetical protein
MTVQEWLEMAKVNAVRRGMTELPPILEGVAKATEALRAEDWNDDASGPAPRDGEAQS